ncbi:MAG: hypothetical protein JXQ73_27345 [Phycisphaerae bacterium]|nr:hypothetical protein [Phycisphaerae bacterium]
MSATDARRLGTFGGVFVPNVLTILGVIMFLRTGWVVGKAGLQGALLILLIANAITLLTALSLAAVATNTKVGVGGAYFLISRSLGLEVGGSVGVPLYFAQAISVAFYLVGFSESLQGVMPGVDVRVTASAALGVFFIIAWVGASLAVKAQYLILVLLTFSLASFFTGYTPVPDPAQNWAPAYGQGHTIWTVFAIFFPAVTGIMSGVSMSGDLRNPSVSIPRGTIAAVLLTFVIYAAQMVWLSLNADRSDLVADSLIMRRIASVPSLILAGLWAASLSSGLASLVAAPRTLQALSLDRVMPRRLAKGIGASSEPRVALIATALIAEACILIGDLNLIAPVITMFFLTTYGTVNFVAGVERLVLNPSYRPVFKVHWIPSLLGALGCVFVMFLINVWATLAAIVVIGGIYGFLARVRFRTAWGDVRSGLWFVATRSTMLRFEASRQHVRNWRPALLVLSGAPSTRLDLIQFARWIEADRGLLFLAQVVTGEWEKLLPRHQGVKQALQDFIKDHGLSAFGTTVIADDFEHGVATLLQVTGLGQFQPNTVMMGWSEDAVRQAAFARAVRRILELERNLIVFAEAEPDQQLDPVIDVWWYAKDNGSLMLTLAHLLRSNRRWHGHRIRVSRIITDEAGEGAAEEGTRELLAGFRIETDVRVIVSEEPPLEVIARASERSEVCFAGIAVERIAEQDNPLAAYADLVARLRGNVLLTKSWHDLKY